MITAARWISLIAAFFWGAVAEYHLGIAVGADRWTAALLPLTLDVYGFAAMKSGRTSHVAGALVTMFGAQTAAHLLALVDARWWMTSLAIVVSAVPPAVSLACHRLGVKRITVDAEADTVDAEDYTEQIGAYATVAPVDAPGYTVHKSLTHYLADQDADAEETETYGEAVHADAARIVANDATLVTPVDAVDARVEAPVADVTRTVSTVDMTPADYAREGARLIADGYTKTAAADTLGISRQWLHACMAKVAVNA